MRNRIAFIKHGSFSHINRSVQQALSKEFPDCELSVTDVNTWVNAWSPANLLSVAREYGFEILAGKKNIRTCRLKNSHFFQSIRSGIRSNLPKTDLLFTFQTQSLFDASVAGLPHVVYTDHTHLANLRNPHFDRNNYFPKWVDLEHTIYDNATLILTMSENISRSLIEQYDCSPDKVVCVYAGSNICVPPYERDLDSYTRKNVLFVGVDWERKGGPDLVAAFQAIQADHPNASLTIVGCSPKVDLPNCNVVGRLPPEELGPYYEAATVFCLPTRVEPLGIVFAEALNYQLPIIAPDIEAVPGFVVDGRTGCLANTVDEITVALDDLLSDPAKCMDFGRQGGLLAADRYSWDRVGWRMKEAISAIV